LSRRTRTSIRTAWWALAATTPALARGLEVIETGRPVDHQGWLRRVVGPLLHWPHPGERAA
jgi:hypothetical protein